MTKICFVHRGNPEYLKYAVLQSKAIGFEPVIIGDDATNIGVGSFYQIKEFSKTSEMMKEVYSHLGVNPYEYELFCLQRWFIIAEYMKQNGGPLWVADHDILIYDSIKYIDRWFAIIGQSREFMLDSAWLNFISSAAVAEKLQTWILKVYDNKEKLFQMADRNAINDTPHISDMHLLREMAQEWPDLFLNISTYGSDVGLDPNIRIIDNYQNLNGHKTIEWRNGAPYATLTNGEQQEFSSLHFQGPSKFLMQFMHTVPEEKQAVQLTDFSDRVMTLPDDLLGTQIKSEFARLKASGQNL